jgi:phosphatidylserine decarboxylase
MHARRNPFIANEGVLPMVLVAVAAALLFSYVSPQAAIVPGVLLFLMFLLFRDPRRAVPAVALGVVSPVDGEVVSIEKTDDCVIQGEAYRIRIRVNWFGAYTARSPVEGKVMNLRSRLQETGQKCPENAMWLLTDEGDNVILQFHGHRFWLAPRAFIGFGERVGQGHRCAYLRLSRYADVYLPIAGRVHVKTGDHVRAGSDVIGAVPRA